MVQSKPTAMICLCLLLAATHLVAQSLPFRSPAETGMDASQLRRIEQEVGEAMDAKELAGAVTLVLHHGNIVHLEAHGWQNLEGHIPMQADTVFRIYSMTKPIIATAVMMLVEAGHLDLDLPVASYLPELKGLMVFDKRGNRPPQRPPTLRDLLRHTAGMTYGYFGNTPVDEQYRQARILDRDQDSKTFLNKVAGLPLLYDPGEKWVYSIAVDVQGVLVEAVSGLRLDAFLKKHLFQPLGMKDTGFEVPREKAHRLACYYGSDLELRESAEDSPYLKRPTFLSGGGGLVSTAMDYAHFVQMLINGGTLFGQRLLKTESVEAMTRNQLPSDRFPEGIGGGREGLGFGLGVSVVLQPGPALPDARKDEYGWDGIASTHFWVSPADKLAVITMEQTQPFSKTLIGRLKGPIYGALQPSKHPAWHTKP